MLSERLYIFKSQLITYQYVFRSLHSESKQFTINNVYLVKKI